MNRFINKATIYVFLVFISIFIVSCVPDPLGDRCTGSFLAELKVDLDISSDFIRIQEAPAGNLIADSILYSLNQDEEVMSELKNKFNNNNLKIDLVLINSGAIRYSRSCHPSAVIPSGDFTTGTLNEIQPFTNIIYIIQVTGAKLEQILEHSVSNIENTEGRFLQVSKGFVVKVDKSKKPETLKLKDDGEYEIFESGERIFEMKINNILIDPLANYYIVTSDYVAGGGDDFISFTSITDDFKYDTKKTFKDAIEKYVIDKEVVEPKVEGRIIYIGE